MDGMDTVFEKYHTKLNYENEEKSKKNVQELKLLNDQMDKIEELLINMENGKEAKHI